MTVGFRETRKMQKLARYLDEIPEGHDVEASTISKRFCLSNAAAAGKFILLHGSFVKREAGLWRKVA